jgi:hypothetical protein
VAAGTTGSTSEDWVFQDVRRSSFEEGSAHREGWAILQWSSGGMEVEETAAVASEGLSSVGIEGKRSQNVKTPSVAGTVE